VQVLREYLLNQYTKFDNSLNTTSSLNNTMGCLMPKEYLLFISVH